MRENKILDSDVDFAELASLTKNFSGAEINGLVKSAASLAFNRHVKVGTLAEVAPAHRAHGDEASRSELTQPVSAFAIPHRVLSARVTLFDVSGTSHVRSPL